MADTEERSNSSGSSSSSYVDSSLMCTIGDDISNMPSVSSSNATQNSTAIAQTGHDEKQSIADSNTEEQSKIAISSLIDLYENPNLSLEIEAPLKPPKIEPDCGKTIKLKNHLYLLIHNGLFLLEYSNSKSSTKPGFFSLSIPVVFEFSNFSFRQQDHDSLNDLANEDLLRETMSNATTALDTIDKDFLKIINICQPSDIIQIIVKCEQDHFDPNETNYICIVEDRKLRESVFLGITIDSNDQIQIGMVIDCSCIGTVEIVGDGCIYLNLQYEHLKSIKISPIQNFWRTLQYLPTWSSQSDVNASQDFSPGRLSKSKSYIGLTSNELNCLNTASLVNRFRSMLTPINRITFLWHHNDYHTSDLLGDTLLELNVSENSIKKQLRDLLFDIMIVPNVGDLTLDSIYGQLAGRFDRDIKPYKCFIANETIRIYGQMEMANEILPYLYLGSDFNASDINFLRSHNITHVLNATKEVNNFYVGTLTYFNVNVYDRPEAEILPFFNECFQFIENARKNGSNVLVHCHMGISRSASVVIAYLMKKFKYSFDHAYAHVKQRRRLIRPNKGFVKQLQIYEGMVHNKRLNFENGDSNSHCESIS